MSFGHTPGATPGAAPSASVSGAPGDDAANEPRWSLEVPPGTKIGDRYEIVRLIGEGGMGAVFEARHIAIGRQVAVKLLRGDLARDKNVASRFLHEARAANEVRHKNIVEIIDFGGDERRLYLVMEYLRGESLQALIDREAPLAIGQIVRILDPIIRALALAHERGIVHRDVKPENIYLSREDESDEPIPKLLDFGIAKRFDDSDVRLTATGITMGTPAYMAPEQAAGARSISGAVDQYAIGAIIYEALTGHVPHEADTYNAMIVMRATSAPTRLDAYSPELDADLVTVVMRALAQRPADRFGSMHELRAALEPFSRITDSTVAGARPISRHGRTAKDGSPVAGETMLAPSIVAIPAIARGAVRTQPSGTPVRGGDETLLADGHAPSTVNALRAATPAPVRESHGPATAGGSVSAVSPVQPSPAYAQTFVPAGDAGPALPSAASLGVRDPASPASSTDSTSRLAAARALDPIEPDEAFALVARRRTNVWIAAGALGGAVSVVLVVLALRGGRAASPPGESRAAPPVTAPAPAVVPSEQVTFTFDFEPANAEILLDDQRLGAGHAAVTRTRDGHRFQLRVSAPGHEPYTEVVTADSNARISHRLVAMAGTAAVAPHSATPSPARPGSSGSNAHAVARPTPTATAAAAARPEPRDPPPGVDPAPANNPPSHGAAGRHVHIDRNNPFGP